MMEKPEEKPTVLSPAEKTLKEKGPIGLIPPAEKTLKEKGPFGLLGGIFMILGAVGVITCGMPWAPFMGAPAPVRVGIALRSTWEVSIVACYAVAFMFGIIELIGGIFAIKRTHWAFALIVTILNLNTLGIIFVAVGRKEFK